MSIASEISRLQGAKADIKTAIEGKGVTVPSATKLDGYADLVDAIPQGSTPTGTKQISVTQNGTQTENVSGYASAQLNVAVPNSYSAGDEGKVVNNGALVAQTAHADVTPTTSDQTIDTNTNDSIKVKGDADLVASNIKKDVEIFGVTGSYEGGGGGGNEVIQTTAINNSVGNVTFDMVLQALEDMNYTLTYTDCILKFRAKGPNANSSPPSNYAFNNHTVLVKNGVLWNKNYNRNRYAAAATTPDGFSGIAAYETNNPFADSEGMIDANHKIVNKFSK